jgi:hypothetical protein
MRASRVALLVTCHLALVTLLSGCATQRAQVNTWWNSSGKTNLEATGALLAQQAATIAARTVYAKGLSAADIVLKNQNVQGFGDGLRELESGLASAAIGQIPDFVMRLRQIWLPPQQHYTDLAAHLGTLIMTETARLEAQSGRKLTSDEAKAVIEGIIKGLQSPPVVVAAVP